ncbi:MAG: InlB B-repeat-containing protein, partial [Bacteroidales bacterium]|nr:InlB B-repeat-containing protein [Bacteroidales bacterium]
ESLTKNADGNYTFTVPSENVTISRVITDVWNVENGADGSADHPYIITTPAGLDLLATKVNADVYYQKHFELGADIDYKDVPAKDESGSNFTPIGKDRDYSFKGSFDGKEYTISGIVLNSENASFQGLFGYVGWSDDYSDNSPIVKNVTLASSTIKGANLVGGIAGGSAGMISNCTVKSDVKIYAQECGGILEYNNGFVENCTSSAQLEGNSNVGGIAGESRRHGLANNRAIGVKISGTFQYAGAITPYTSSEDSLHNNFYLNCKVLDKTAGIGLDGEDFTKNNGAVPVYAITLCDGITITTDPSITYNETNYYAQGTVLELQKNIATTYYANGEEISGETFTMPAKDVTFTRDYIITYDLNGGALPTGTDNPTIFTVEDGEITLPTPTHEYGTFGGWYDYSSFEGDAITTINSADATDFYLCAKWNFEEITEIYTPDDLKKFSASVNGGNTYEGKTVTLMNDIDFEPSAETTENFDGIGQLTRPFSGTFDGGNHTISGIRINKPNGDKYGLFGVLQGAVIKNIVLDNARIICNSNNGGIVGYMDGGTIIGCTITNKVTIISTQQGNNLGGIVGWFIKGTISDCVSKATITANEGKLFGGIAGWMESGTIISHCTSYATIKVNQSSMGGFGGIVGFNVSGTIEDNLVIDATITFNTSSGAIAGFNRGTLKNNFYYNTTVNGATTGVGCNGADIPDDNGAVYADLLIDGNSNDDVPTSTSTGNQTVVLQRTFSVGVNSTLMLPFGFTADADFQVNYGSFYSITSIGYNEQDKCWEAQLSDPVTQVEANKPYIFVPAKGVGFIPFNDVTIDESDPQDVTFGEKDEWTFKGVYSKVTLTSDADHKYFCFASAKESDGIKAGEFVKIGRNVGVKACRCYLVYSGTDSRLSKSATELPDRIVVIFPDGTSSVITPDEPETPITGDDDITTPVSEIVPSVNVKVWSYDKTIFIESPAGTDYRIIDLNGRTLKSATTTTSRDEIHLGNASGIVIVIINGKTYKTLY